MGEVKEQSPAVKGDGMTLLIAWLWVSIPLAWGLADTVNNAVKLFR
jgi:hypothetical protein